MHQLSEVLQELRARLRVHLVHRHPVHVRVRRRNQTEDSVRGEHRFDADDLLFDRLPDALQRAEAQAGRAHSDRLPLPQHAEAERLQKEQPAQSEPGAQSPVRLGQSNLLIESNPHLRMLPEVLFPQNGAPAERLLIRLR